VDRSLNLQNKLVLNQFNLANTWQLAGNLKYASICYQEVLQLQPDHLPAHQQLANLMIAQNRIEEALDYYDRSLTLDFEATDLSCYYQYLGLLKVVKIEYTSFPTDRNNIIATGKIKLGNQRVFGLHRSGWNFALQSLRSLHNPQGVLFDGFLDDSFLLQNEQLGVRSPRILAKMRTDEVFEKFATLVDKGVVPYQQPWVGFMHNPQSMPLWFNYHQRSPQKLCEKAVWQASLPYCLGLFALSNYHAEWLREQTGKPVSVLTHPTEIPDKQFNFQLFIANPQKKIVQIGWWLRKLNSIYQLPLAQNNALGYTKLRIGSFFGLDEPSFENLLKLEAKIYKQEVDPIYKSNTIIINHISNDEYDDLLSMNIGFVDLYDSSANNAIVECIARATPLLINPLPAVQEYLGEEYPMYFQTLEEAANKALDLDLIMKTHQYLKHCETRQKLSGVYFANNFINSEVYKNI
jgi:tetratricopeptide (TPR) repeat protein